MKGNRVPSYLPKVPNFARWQTATDSSGRNKMATGQSAAYIKSVLEVNLLQIDYNFMNKKGVQCNSLQLIFLQRYRIIVNFQEF